jgi:hypothetical protein
MLMSMQVKCEGDGLVAWLPAGHVAILQLIVDMPIYFTRLTDQTGPRGVNSTARTDGRGHERNVL